MTGAEAVTAQIPQKNGTNDSDYKDIGTSKG